MVAVALLAFFYPRRPRYAAASKERPVNVLQDEDDGDGLYHDLPHDYTLQPFILPDPNLERAPGGFDSLRERPHPMTPTDILYPQTATTTSTRKSSVPSPTHPINIIQHDDAGPSDEPETIELPPAYAHIRSSQRSSGTVPTPTTPTTTKSTTSRQPLCRNSSHADDV